MHRTLSIAALLFPMAALSVNAEAPSPSRAHPAPGTMIVSRLEGSATSSGLDSQPAHELTLHEQLVEGSTVATGAASRLEITFVSGTVLRLGESTRLELREAPAQGGQFHARLWVGNFWAHVHKLVAGERFELETENAVAGVRGTTFRVEAAAMGSGLPDVVRVYDGAVQVDDKLHAEGVRVLPGHEVKAGSQAGPASTRVLQSFDAKRDAATPFMAWVRAMDLEDAQRAKDAQERDDKQERSRDRLRRILRRE